MPTVPDEIVPWRKPMARTMVAQQEEESPGVIDTLGAAGTVANWPYRSWRYLSNRAEAVDDPNHDPFEAIKGTRYESDPERFAHSRSEEETRAIMREWDADDEANDTLRRAGWAGTVAAVGMGMLDPTMFIPVGTAVRGVMAGRRALALAGDVAVTAGASAAIAEGALAATTPERTAMDVAQGIGTATLLGGLLGGGAGALLSRAERSAAERAFTADRKAWGQEMAGKPPAPQAAGAAASDERDLIMATPRLLRALPDITGKVAPPRRVLNSGFATARRTLVDLVETPYVFEDNLKGVATTQGPALDRLARMETGKARVAVAQAFDEAYTRYRFGGAAETWRQSLVNRGTRALDVARTPEGGKADFATFRTWVDEALRNGDKHPVQEAAEVAKIIRETAIVPWRDRAIKAGLLPDDVDVATAESYMMRVWNKQRLISERPAAVKVFSDWLEGEEARKIALQDLLRGLKAELDAIDEAAAKLKGSKKLGAEAELVDLDIARGKVRARIEEAIGRWDGKSSKGAKAALKARAAYAAERQGKIEGGTFKGETFQGEGDRLTGADSDVDAAVKTILDSERRRDRKDIEALAQEIVDRIVGNPDGRLPYDAASARASGPTKDARGPLAARDFMIPDELVRDFLDTDAQNVAEIYLNTMVPDVLLTERFGDVDMSEAFRKLKDEAAAAQMSAATPAERQKIKARYDATVADLAAMRDRIRHTYGYSSDPRQRMLGRVAATAARYDIMTNLGGAALSSLPDLAGIQWQVGFGGAFKGAWKPFFKALGNPETRKALSANKAQLRRLGIAAETWLNTRTASLHDVTDLYRPTTRFERGIKFGADKFGNVSLLAQWTDFGKLAAGMVSQGEIIDGARALGAGKATAKQTRLLAENGIDAAMADRILKAVDAEGGADVVDDIQIPNTGLWQDRGAREAFEGAVGRMADIMIITPGAERPLIMSNPIGALLLQYKSFVVAANERLLVRSLQTRDRAVLAGMASAIGLGILSEAIYSWIVDRDLPARPGDLIKAGVTRSGMLGWYQEGNAMAEKWFDLDAFRLIGAKRPDSRYVNREKLSAALGPTAGKLESLIRSGANIAELDWTAGDTRRMRRLLIGQNLFYIRLAFDKLGDGEARINRAFGIEPLPGG